MTIKEDLINFWYEYLSKRTTYPCILSSVELSDDDIRAFKGYPLIRFDVIEVNTESEGYLVSREIKGNLIEKYIFNAEYMLEIQVYYKSDKKFDLDKLLYELSNKNIFTRYTLNKDFKNRCFKDIVLRGDLKITNINDYLQQQTISRYRYQQNFIVDIEQENIIPLAKIGNIKEVKN